MNMRYLSLMNLKSENELSGRSELFLSELDWLFSRTQNPGEALLVPYAYNGPNYLLFFKELQAVFGKRGINLIDLRNPIAGKPRDLITKAKMYVVCGGDPVLLAAELNKLKMPEFNPFFKIKENVESGVPYLGWNAGSVIASPISYTFPENPLSEAFRISPFQILINYSNNSNADTNPIKQFLIKNNQVKKAYAMIQVVDKDKTSVRLEESGAGLLSATTGPGYMYELDPNGNLIYREF